MSSSMEDEENIENSMTGFGSSQEKRIVKENSQQPEYDDPASNLGSWKTWNHKVLQSGIWKI